VRDGANANGACSWRRHAWDSALDLKNFHQGSHAAPIITILVPTESDLDDPKIPDPATFKLLVKCSLPSDIDRYLATLAKLYSGEANSECESVLVNSAVLVEEGVSHDNWNGGMSGHDLVLRLPTHTDVAQWRRHRAGFSVRPPAKRKPASLSSARQ